MVDTRPRVLSLWLCATALTSFGCRGPEQRLVDYADEFRSLYDDHRETPRDGLLPIRDYLRAHVHEAEAAAGDVAAELTAAPEVDRQSRARKALASVEPALAGLDAAARAFEVQAAGDPSTMDALAAIGADEITALHARHDAAISGLLRTLRRTLAFASAAEAVSEIQALSARACGCRERACLLAGRAEVQAFVTTRLPFVDPSVRQAVRDALSKAKACVKADPSQFD